MDRLTLVVLMFVGLVGPDERSGLGAARTARTAWFVEENG